MNGPNISVGRRLRWPVLALLSFSCVFGLGCPNGPSDGDSGEPEAPLPDEGGTLVVFQVDMGDAGIIEIVAGDPPTTCVNAVFSGDIPEDATSGTVSVSLANVELLPADAENLQALIPQAQISVFIAPADAPEDSADPTAEEYEVLSFTAINDETGLVRLNGATASLSTETIELLVGGNYLLCLRVVANFEGTVEVREVEITLGGDSEPTGCGESTDACDDGNPCTSDDRCLDGTCAGDLVVDCVLCDQDSDCDDDDGCTDDSCGPAGVCGNTDNALACDDGDPCTDDDRCLDGTCAGDLVVECVACDQDSECADDGNLCTDASCGPDGTCVSTDNTLACNDLDPCTEDDVCSGGECAGTMIAGCACQDDTDCDNGLYCDGLEWCSAEETCQPGEPVDCDDQIDCTADSCNEDTDACDHVGDDAACDDGLFCTLDDSCDPELGCVTAGSPCAADQFCDEADQTCDDCTEDSHCDDGNSCTDDTCDPELGCLHVDNSDLCDDGSACTTGDACSAGVCSGSEIVCDDGVDCTDDSCDSALGCQYVNNAGLCDDGNACTDDSCDGVLGCQNVDNTAACDDGDPCTTGDTCANGDCVGGVPLDCDDGNACTDDSCEAGVGCQNADNSDACDDGDDCTEDDICADGVCAGDAPTFTLTVNVLPNGTGEVQLDPDSPDGVYDCGTEVTLTATPLEEGLFFVRWGGDATGSENPLVLTMETDMTVTAFFNNLNDTWSFDREVTASECPEGDDGEPQPPGTQDSTTTEITQDGSDFTFTLSYTGDADEDDKIDESPGELWFEFIPLICDEPEPFELAFTGTISGNTVSASITGLVAVWCECVFITDATLDGTVIDGAGTIEGTMSVNLLRDCPQFETNECWVDYAFTATRQ